jgi:hypothetical protein
MIITSPAADTRMLAARRLERLTGFAYTRPL